MDIKKRMGVFGAVIIALVAFVWVMNRGGESDNVIETPSTVSNVPVVKELPEKSSAESPISPVTRVGVGEKKGYIVQSDGTVDEDQSGDEADAGADRDAAADRADQAVDRWDALVDLIVERQGVADRTQLERVKKSFDELDPEDKLPAINMALGDAFAQFQFRIAANLEGIGLGALNTEQSAEGRGEAGANNIVEHDEHSLPLAFSRRYLNEPGQAVAGYRHGGVAAAVVAELELHRKVDRRIVQIG